MRQAPRRSVRCVVWVAVACLITLTVAVAASSGDVSWDPATPLTWSLFQAPPPADAIHRNEAAAIHMTIRWHASYSVVSNGGPWTGRIETVTVTNTMEPSLSWVVTAKADAQVLHHEQVHFDLNEVYRRKLETVLTCIQAQHPTKQGVLDALNTALHQKADVILTQLQVAQERFDAESCHGNNLAAQGRWEWNIADWLVYPASAP